MFHLVTPLPLKTLMFLTQPQQRDKDACIQFLHDQGLNDVTVFDRTKEHIPYRDMPKFLSQFGMYVDIRYQDGKLIDDWSATAEQCLHMGMVVYDWDGKPHHGLDSRYKSENVLAQLEDVYESITSTGKVS